MPRANRNPPSPRRAEGPPASAVRARPTRARRGSGSPGRRGAAPRRLPPRHPLEGKTTWSPGCTGISTPAPAHQSSPGPTASTMPCSGGGSCVPGGTTSPERRTRSWSSSLITIWSNSGRSWCRTDSVGSGRCAVPMDASLPEGDEPQTLFTRPRVTRATG